MIQEHPGEAQDFTDPAQPCDKVPRTKKSWAFVTAAVAGETQSTNSTIIRSIGCIKLNTWATEQDTIISGSVQPQNWGMIPTLTSILEGEPDIAVADELCLFLWTSITTYKQI